MRQRGKNVNLPRWLAARGAATQGAWNGPPPSPPPPPHVHDVTVGSAPSIIAMPALSFSQISQSSNRPLVPRSEMYAPTFLPLWSLRAKRDGGGKGGAGEGPRQRMQSRRVAAMTEFGIKSGRRPHW